MQKILTLPFILLYPFIEIRVNNLEELLRKSRQLNSSKSLRLIDQQIENLPTNQNSTIENLILSCNKLGKYSQIDFTKIPNHLQVDFLLFYSVFRIIWKFSMIY